jgi:predicted nucleotidyltransferase
MPQHNILVPQEKIAAFCQRYPIRKLSLFGSVLRDDFHSSSDIDVLVELEPGHGIGLFTIAGMELELTELFGRKVDLRTPQELSPYFRQRVLDAAEVLYVRG